MVVIMVIGDAKMSTIICFANNKGGVGKSTLTMNLGSALSELRQKDTTR
jgi:cellulose biosynthesis protein BcsQ